MGKRCTPKIPLSNDIGASSISTPEASIIEHIRPLEKSQSILGVPLILLMTIN
ncbi:MAG: hypothetical protein IJU76_02525 [Desulfovibrionaceae bacterium]|nr:hypothetical protein [Desulfovibrionaceae bacterium]